MKTIGCSILRLLFACGAFGVASARAERVFWQDFTFSSETNIYVSATPDNSQFHNLGTNAGGRASIEDGGLLFSYEATGGSAGFLRAELTAAPGLMRFQAQITIDRTNAASGDTFTDISSFYFGDRPKTDVYDVYPHLNALFEGVRFKGQGAYGGGYSVEGTAAYDYQFGQSYTLTVLLNDSGVGQSYTGPDEISGYGLSSLSTNDADGDPYAQGTYAVWMDTDLVVSNAAANTFVHNGNWNSRDLDTVWLKWDGNNASLFSVWFDEIKIWDTLDIPPSLPVGMAVFAK